MAKYSIEETTLTAIGDALRRKHGETRLGTVIEEIEVPAVVVSKTPNATGFDSWEGAYWNEGDETATCDVVHIPNAKKIKIKVAYEFLAGHDSLEIATGAYYTLTEWFANGATKKIIGGGVVYAYEEIEATDTEYLTFKVSINKGYTGDRNKIGYYAECIGYDENGEPLGTRVIQVEKEAEVPNTYSSAEMAQAIDDIEVGEILPEEAFVITGSCDYKFANGGWDWYLELFGDKVVTKDITSAANMFNGTKIKTLPFEINFKDGGANAGSMFSNSKLEEIPSIDFKHTTYKNTDYMFQYCYELRQIGTIKNLYPNSMTYMFSGCRILRSLPDFENLNMDRMYTYAYAGCGNMFYGCYSLRSINEEFLKKIYNPIATSGSNTVLYNTFNNCYSLDEIKGLNPQTGKLTSNGFSNTFNSCYRLKDLFFATQEDGSPYVVNWSKQTIDLSSNVGYATASTKKDIINYNSGITADKEVTDDASYQALKDDPDWFTANIAYSRYNKESAIRTINSLPDASAGTGNVIKFRGAAGSATDGGAIQDMDETMIALAASRGWTVTFA